MQQMASDEAEHVAGLSADLEEQAAAVKQCPRVAAVCLMHQLAALVNKQNTAEALDQHLSPDHIIAAGKPAIDSA